MPRTRTRKLKRATDGNVGARQVTPGPGHVGEIHLWVETPDQERTMHSLYLTRDEAQRLSDVLCDLLDEMGL